MTESRISSEEDAPRKLTLRRLTDLLDSLPASEGDPEIQVVELQPDQVLFRQGDEADSMYVLLAGVLDVRLAHDDGTESTIDRLAPGAMVGELALLSGQKRSASVYAVNGASLIRLSRAQFEALAGADGEAQTTVDTVAAPRWQRVHLSKALRGLFGDLQPATLHALQRELEWLHLSSGHVVFKQGAPSDGLYIVVNGRLCFRATTPDGQEAASGEIKVGETVGEFSLLTGEARSATVYATRETTVARMTPAIFEGAARRHPELAVNITRAVVKRQQEALTQTKPVALATLTLAVLPAGPQVDARQFAQELGNALARFGSTLAIDSEGFDRRYGQTGAAQSDPGDPRHPAIVAWMDELEAATNYLIFVADSNPSAWTRRCIGQADRVLILADARGDPNPGAAEGWLQEMQVPVRHELVLWHPPETQRPQGTRDWLERRQIHTHHHIKRGDPEHMERLARRLTGRAIAVVLSGGGARGFAHLGVHRALKELDIPIDCVGGTSFGALVSGAFHVSDSNAELMRLSAVFSKSEVLFDYTLPFTSLMASNKLTRFCQAFYGDLQIEDLWFPSFFVAANLSRAEPVTFQRGPLWWAVRASVSIPGVFTPVVDNDEVLADGGVMDNFPVSIMAGLVESEHIIGVNVTPYKVKKRQYDYETGISGWRILFSRINPFTKPLRAPSIVNTLLRSLEVNSARLGRMHEAQVDLFLHPEPKSYGLLDFDKFEPIAQVGYEAALEPLREWKQRRLQGQARSILMVILLEAHLAVADPLLSSRRSRGESCRLSGRRLAARSAEPTDPGAPGHRRGVVSPARNDWIEPVNGDTNDVNIIFRSLW